MIIPEKNQLINKMKTIYKEEGDYYANYADSEPSRRGYRSDLQLSASMDHIW